MWWHRHKKAKIDIVRELDTSSLEWCGEAVLISVEGGKGALRHEGISAGADSGGMTPYAVTLCGVPLMYGKAPGRRADAGMLATGWGIENAVCDELKALGDLINQDFVDLQTSVDILSPLLGLLESGLYVVADAAHYPTDGAGRFFWDVPDDMTENPATAMVCPDGGPYTEGQPVFLYPSKTAQSFSEQRAAHYAERFAQTDKQPRAVAYHFSEFLSVLLDGHHKAAAALLLGQTVSCITILPMTSIVFEPPYTKRRQVVSEVAFHSIRVSHRDIPAPLLQKAKDTFRQSAHSKLHYEKRSLAGIVWDDKYTAAAARYPSVSDVCGSAFLGLGDITDDMIEECLNDLTDTNAQKLKYMLSVCEKNKDARTKTLALFGAVQIVHAPLKEAAFRVLAAMKDAADAEAFFVEYLVEDCDPHSALRMIAESFWKQ